MSRRVGTRSFIRVLIWREFGVLYDSQYVCYVASQLGIFVSKGPVFVSDHLDTAKRLAWLEEKWPAISVRPSGAKG